AATARDATRRPGRGAALSPMLRLRCSAWRASKAAATGLSPCSWRPPSAERFALRVVTRPVVFERLRAQRVVEIARLEPSVDFDGLTNQLELERVVRDGLVARDDERIDERRIARLQRLIRKLGLPRRIAHAALRPQLEERVAVRFIGRP